MLPVPIHPGGHHMNKRQFLKTTLAAAAIPAIGRSATKTPLVPKWQPSFTQPLDRIAATFAYYADKQRNFVVLSHGTCVIFADGLSDIQAAQSAEATLTAIINYHADMNPAPMDDGNILVRYNHPAFNVVFTDIATTHWQEINSRHLDGLVPEEVLITPQGPNIFDDFGKKALYGRACMFLDAQVPSVKLILRREG